MHICYIDESGDSQPIRGPKDDKQPLLVIGGLFVRADRIRDITSDFIKLKRTYYPGALSATHDLDVLLSEIKGSDLRADIRRHHSKSRLVQHHFRFLDDVLALCKTHRIKIVARIWVKSFGIPINDKSVYTTTAQNIARRFQVYLAQNNSRGMMIADHRDPARNQYVAHSVFTQKHKMSGGGDAFPLIDETAVFGMSNNHACLQIADLICSTILAPISARALLKGVIDNTHTHVNFDAISKRYSRRLKALQFHCDYKGRFRYWGITAKDPYGKKTSIF